MPCSIVYTVQFFGDAQPCCHPPVHHPPSDLLGPSSFRFQFLDLAFTAVFDVIGGILGDSYNVIYEFLDWGQAPVKAVSVVSVILFIMLPLVHGLHVIIARYREKLRRDQPNWGWQVRGNFMRGLTPSQSTFDMVRFLKCFPDSIVHSLAQVQRPLIGDHGSHQSIISSAV